MFQKKKNYNRRVFAKTFWLFFENSNFSSTKPKPWYANRGIRWLETRTGTIFLKNCNPAKNVRVWGSKHRNPCLGVQWLGHVLTNTCYFPTCLRRIDKFRNHRFPKTIKTLRCGDSVCPSFQNAIFFRGFDVSRKNRKNEKWYWKHVETPGGRSLEFRSDLISV